MGLRGPAPKPTKLRQLEGNPGRLPINENEPEPEPGADPPDWLPVAAREEWRRLAPVLEACGLLTKADGNVFAAYCDAVVNFATLSQAVAELDSLVMKDNYGRRPAAEISAQRNYAELVLKLGAKLGLSPADRTGVKATKPKAGKWNRLIG